jgi:methylenetetrahydrofolate reductase (NADPH)
MRGRTPLYSFEFFPPKTPQGTESLLRTLEDLRSLQPAFVSVTYGAMGSNRGQMIELVSRIKHDLGLNPMAHLTCVGHTQADLAAILDRLASEGVKNVLTLRGDPPKGETFKPVAGGFAFASEFAAFVHRRWNFCLGGAAYPETHPEAKSPEDDLRNLVRKVEAGVNFLVTQLFFSNSDYFSFVERARGAGIQVPIVPGIMPLTEISQVERFTSLMGVRVPESLTEKLSAASGDERRIFEIGVQHAIEQCRDLLAAGVPGIHFYTLNKSPATRQILTALRAG